MIDRTAPASAAPPALLLPVETILPRASLHRAQAEGTLRELMHSIRTEGLRRPILVRRSGPGRYTVVSGNRRLMACRRLGMQSIAAVLLPPLPGGASPQDLLSALAARTCHYLDAADMMRQLNTRYGMSREAIARSLGTTAQAVTARLSLMGLSEPLRAFLMEEGAPERIARALLRLPDEHRRMAIARRAARERLCIRDVEALITASLTRRCPALAVDAPPRRVRNRRVDRLHPSAPPPGRRVLTLMRDTRPYINAIREITRQMRIAGVNATLTENDCAGLHEVTLRFPAGPAK